MKKSFKDTLPEEDLNVEPVVNEEEQSLVLNEGAPLATQTSPIVLGAVVGEVDEKDLKVPTLKLTQSVGPLSETFDAGTFILNGTQVLAQPEVPLTLSVLSIRKYYIENLPYDPNGPRARVFETKQELVDAELWTEWRNDERPPAVEIADVSVLIKQPDEVDLPSFSFSLGVDSYCLARWTLRGTGYTSAAKSIFTALSVELAPPKRSYYGLWSLHSERQKRGGNMVQVPVLTLTGIRDEEDIARIEDRFAS